MTKEIERLYYLLHTIYSKKPKRSRVKCSVPNCNREWYLTGGHQGFTLASAQSHAFAHWKRFHKQHNHSAKYVDVCEQCIATQKYGDAI